MSITITDPTLLAQLMNSMGVTELLDPSGQVIGTFQTDQFGQPPPGYVPPITDEEIVRRRQQYRSGRALSEIVKRIES